MIGVVVAMDCEAEVLLSSLEIESVSSLFGKPVYKGTAYDREFIVVVCGIGKVNASIGACAAISLGAEIVLNYGVAGGLLPSRTEVEEIYLIDRAVQYDFDLTQINGTEIGTLDEYEENYLPLTLKKMPFETRSLATGDRFNDSKVDHDLLLELGADIRDMEGAAVVQTCKASGVPCVEVKAISDVYGSGSTTEQYLKNRSGALAHLKAHFKDIVKAL